MSFNSLFLQACKQQKVERLPVWYMRQAGRYDPDYQKIKEKYTLMEICAQPELAAQVTMMPVRKLAVDAAILYSDIMNPVASMGADFDIIANVGPVVHSPIRSEQDIARLRPIHVQQDLAHILETIHILKRELHVPLISFAGGPFTIASYLIEGKPSKQYRLTKQLMYQHPQSWFKLMDKLGDMVITYLSSHIQAGADAVQIFDSWVGVLSPMDYRDYVLPTITRIFDSLKHFTNPKIYFPGVSSGELLSSLTEVRADVIGIDWRTSIPDARLRLQHRFAIQGNLDPFVLTAPRNILEQQAKVVIDQGLTKPGYIFNLGHGVYPEASLSQLQHLTEFVHTYSEKIMDQQHVKRGMNHE
jgi:uroporphyrinogen decarboxylase